MNAESASSPHATGPTRRMWLTALATSIAATAALGGLPLFLAHNVWWLAVGSVPALVAAGFYLGWQVGEPEPLYGSILSILYFGIVAVVLFGSTWADKLPDPMPGLATGDSTFFFVWPLVILAAGVAGSIIGGRVVVARSKRAP